MKKIVALVLSLVMALSLCTVAFGATGTALYGLTGDNADSKKEIKNVELTYVKASTVDKYIGFYTADWYDGTTLVSTSFMVPCTQDEASYAVHKNGSMSAWVKEILATDVSTLNGVVVPNYAIYETVATAQKATTALPNCTTTQFKEDGFVGDDDCFYVEFANSTTKLNVNGTIVLATDVCNDTDYVIWASHVFAKGVANDKTGYDVATCLICKGEFACTNDDLVATKNGYKISTGFSYDPALAGDVYDANKYDNGYDFAWGQTYAGYYEFVWQLKAGTTEEIGTAATTTPTTGVESAKTFDAGIAMYVGMSLMSVAGTAVVIGKKKEF